MPRILSSGSIWFSLCFFGFCFVFAIRRLLLDSRLFSRLSLRSFRPGSLPTFGFILGSRLRFNLTQIPYLYSSSLTRMLSTREFLTLRFICLLP